MAEHILDVLKQQQCVIQIAIDILKYWETDVKNSIVVHLFKAIYDQTISNNFNSTIATNIHIENDKSCLFETSILRILFHLPRHIFRFLQECCTYLHLLKYHNLDEEPRFRVLKNFHEYITNYLVYLHGLYVKKSQVLFESTSNDCDLLYGTNEATTPDEWYGDVGFESIQEKNNIYTQYSVFVTVLLDTIQKYIVYL